MSADQLQVAAQGTPACTQEQTSASAQAKLLPLIEIIAQAFDPHGRNPHLAVAFDHPCGTSVLRLLPVAVFDTEKRAREALLDAGVPNSVVNGAIETLMAQTTLSPPSSVGLYDVPFGWSHGGDFGAVYRFGGTAYTARGPQRVYAEGPVPAPQVKCDCAALLTSMQTDAAAEDLLVFAVHFLAPLMQPLDIEPLTIVVSGLPDEDIKRMRTLAKSAFGTVHGGAAIFGTGNHGSELVYLRQTKSRPEAFMLAQEFAAAGPKSRNRKCKSTQPPVALLLTTEADDPKNLAAPRPPAGCMEIPFGGIKDNAERKEAPQPVPVKPVMENHAAVASKTFIAALVKRLDEVLRNVHWKVPRIAERYLAPMGQSPDDAMRWAATIFALLRSALVCGAQLKIEPWPPTVCDRTIDDCAARWFAHRQARETAFERRVLDAVKSAANASSQEQTDAGPVASDREVSQKTIKGRVLLLLTPQAFDTYVVASEEKARVLTVLRKRGLLVTNCDGNQYMVRIDGGRPRFYAIDLAKLSATP
ncbi:hypothetical protein [Ralstonia solanacearum]|uniref:hypothetical protein n=1 Tax=Ralstonia solanacearum TaxID=305 RepID=UPI000E5705F4|nr:hypothetical protein [Ralstonia solanacearum]AXW24562.1 hypothetical protein CJO86_13845 [Ralstonia solanacearum]